MQERHQLELSPCTFRFHLNPPLLQCFSADGHGAWIPSKGSSLPAPNMAAELIQQQNQTSLGGTCEIAEAIRDGLVKVRGMPEPLPGATVFKPEAENLRGVCSRFSCSALSSNHAPVSPPARLQWL